MGVISVNRVHGKGNTDTVQICIEGERICGSGRFSNVYAAEMVSPEARKVAVKNAWEDKPSKTSAIFPEIALLSALSHPNIVSLLYHFTRKVDNQEKLIHCLILDFLPTDIQKLRYNGARFDLLDAKLYSFQLFRAVAYIASKSIVHLDIKPPNLLVNPETGILKLADFGNAQRLTPETKNAHAYQVTRYYRPPELLFGSLCFTTAIDVWSAACVMYELVSNRTLLKGKDTNEQMRLVVDTLGYPSEPEIKAMAVGRPRLSRKAPRGIEKLAGPETPPDVLAILKGMLVYSPKARLTAESALSMDFFKQLSEKPLAIRSNGNAIPDLVEMSVQKTEEAPKEEKKAEEEKDGESESEK